MDTPRVFISYSWTTPEFEQWVLDIATELCENGVDVVLDKWDLKEGQDADAFMEKMVSDSTISKVLIICDKKYAEKSDKRKGGVGTEAQIISRKVYEQQDGNKFVVAACEINDETGKPYLPIYYTSRKYIDFTDQTKYTEKFEELLRWIFNRPLYVKPSIGKVPDYILTDDKVTLGTSLNYKRVIDAFQNGRSNATGCLKDYLDTFALNLENFRIEYCNSRDYFTDINKSIDDLYPYRNEWLEVINRVCQYNPSEANISCVNRFFEQIIRYTKMVSGRTYPSGYEEDNFRFLVIELYLLFIAVLLKNELFEILYNVLNTIYYNDDDYSSESTYDFRRFRFYVETLDEINQREGKNLISPLGDKLYHRSDNNQIIRNRDLCQADFFLCLFSLLHKKTDIRAWYWYPSLILYGCQSYMQKPFEVFARAESKIYFERFKVALGVKSKEDLSKCIQHLQANDTVYIKDRYGRRYNIAVIANVENMATK